ncbi:phosphatase PAP2 family protein [Sphingomonas sp. TX0543]|uniref:phosphatase PAP2 family protein n=1 Tax=Sphingomonas sp. TX0543 TaxID=3399682 RepID=UPI003AFA2AAD
MKVYDGARTPFHNEIPLSWLVWSILASVSAVALLMALNSMTAKVDLGLAAFVTTALGGASTIRFLFRGALSGARCIWRDAAEYYGLFVSICIVGALAAYPISGMSSGFVDAALQQIDDAIGFEWLAWYRFVTEHTAIQWSERVAYETIFLSPAVLLGYFAFTGRKDEARRFIASFWLTALLTLILFAFLPAKGPLAFLWHGPLPYIPASALYQAELITALRCKMASPIDLGALHGLVAAPSFHAASAVLYVRAAWTIKPLRWPITIMNLTMLLATPVEGTHYLADIIAGAAVALIALSLIRVVVTARALRNPATNAHLAGSDQPAEPRNPSASTK